MAPEHRAPRRGDPVPDGFKRVVDGQVNAILTGVERWDNEHHLEGHPKGHARGSQSECPFCRDNARTEQPMTDMTESQLAQAWAPKRPASDFVDGTGPEFFGAHDGEWENELTAVLVPILEDVEKYDNINQRARVIARSLIEGISLVQQGDSDERHGPENAGARSDQAGETGDEPQR